MTTPKTIFTFYQPDPDIFDTLDIPVQPIPVREENQQKIFEKKKVEFADLLDELLVFLNESPDYIPQYQEMVGKLAYFCGIEKGNKKKHEEAADIFEKGLRLNPDNVSLRMNYAQALYNSKQKEDALVHYLKVIDHPEVPIEPITWTLVARMLFDEKQYETAFELLKDVADIVPKSNKIFWELYKTVRDKAGVEEIEEVDDLDKVLEKEVKKVKKDDEEKYYGDLFGDVGKPEFWEDELDDKFGEDDRVESLDSNDSTQKYTCPSCGTNLKPGAKFCGSCGEKIDNIKTPKSAPSIDKQKCPHCGFEIKNGAKFCGACGKKLSFL